MAKLSAHNRREWIRAEKNGVTLAYMSDGVVLQKRRGSDGKWGSWRIAATKWDVVMSLKKIREQLESRGWTLLQVPLEKEAAR
jgi:hypothetical protein